MPGAKPLEIAHACKPKISAAEVSETLDFLVKAKLLKKDKNGVYHQTEKSVSMVSVDAVPVAARDMQRQMGGACGEGLGPAAFGTRHVGSYDRAYAPSV